ncbi:hypothetical protein [Aeromonas popoffii]|jgi:hypothetical protein|uniref:hypothetical protein n=1 Tax=Aeromonas popoffii TaxID=70856 RepID=UPI0030D15F2F
MENEKRQSFPTLLVEMPEIANKFTYLALLQPCLISHQRVMRRPFAAKAIIFLQAGLAVSFCRGI